MIFSPECKCTMLNSETSLWIKLTLRFLNNISTPRGQVSLDQFYTPTKTPSSLYSWRLFCPTWVSQYTQINSETSTWMQLTLWFLSNINPPKKASDPIIRSTHTCTYKDTVLTLLLETTLLSNVGFSINLTGPPSPDLDDWSVDPELVLGILLRSAARVLLLLLLGVIRRAVHSASLALTAQHDQCHFPGWPWWLWPQPLKPPGMMAPHAHVACLLPSLEQNVQQCHIPVCSCHPTFTDTL